MPQARRGDVWDVAVAAWAFLAKYQNAGASGFHAWVMLERALLENDAILIAPSP